MRVEVDAETLAKSLTETSYYFKTEPSQLIVFNPLGKFKYSKIVPAKVYQQGCILFYSEEYERFKKYLQHINGSIVLLAKDNFLEIYQNEESQKFRIINLIKEKLPNLSSTIITQVLVSKEEFLKIAKALEKQMFSIFLDYVSFEIQNNFLKITLNNNYNFILSLQNKNGNNFIRVTISGHFFIELVNLFQRSEGDVITIILQYQDLNQPICVFQTIDCCVEIVPLSVENVLPKQELILQNLVM